MAITMLLLLVLAACGPTMPPTPIPTYVRPSLAEILINLHSPDPYTQEIAVADLRDYGPAAAAAVPDLIALIDDPLNPYGVHELQGESRVSVMETLGAIGPAAVAAAPTLITIAQEPKEHEMVRSAALRALGTLGDRSVVPALIPLLHEPDPGFTRTVGRTIAVLSQRDFPEDDGRSWLTSDGQSVTAVAVRAWWDAEGQYELWK